MTGPFQFPDPDPGLIQAAAGGDRDCLRRLLEWVSPQLRQWALACSGNADDAADLAQDVLILLVRKLSSYRGEARFLTWLYSVTRNQALEARRRKGREERKMSLWKTEAEGTPPCRPNGGAEKDRRLIWQVVTTFLEELPQRQREVFQMSELQGITSPEIGVILGLDPGSVRAALFKARRTLRRRILQSHPEVVQEYLP